MNKEIKKLNENIYKCESLLRELERKSKIITQYVHTSRLIKKENK